MFQFFFALHAADIKLFVLAAPQRCMRPYLGAALLVFVETIVTFSYRVFQRRATGPALAVPSL